jgi:HSP20 family molecular chaperone IbpA
MNYDYSKRSHLLPTGCKDLIDVLHQKEPGIPCFAVVVTDRGFQISAHIPELHSNNIKITMERSALRIAGTWGSSSTPFESVIAVPPSFDAAKATAAYSNGELRILIVRRHKL